MSISRVMAAFVLASALVSPAIVRANANDIRLRGIGRPASNALSDPAVRRYRALSGELALALTPKAVQPAETLGVSGFEFGIINTLSNISQDADYWTGQPGSPVVEGVAEGRNLPSTLWIPTLQVRKGLPLSTDLGFSVSYLTSSRIFMMGADVKVALHESYVRYFPAIAVRASFNRMLGSEELDLFTAEADLIASLAFGVGGTVQVTPYLGFGKLFAHVNSQVLDETPYLVTDSTDQRGGQQGSLYTFPTLNWDQNDFWKVFGGARLITASFTFSYNLDIGIIPYDFVDSSALLSHSFMIGIDT